MRLIQRGTQLRRSTEDTASTAIANVNASKPISDQATRLLPSVSTNRPPVTALTPSRLELLPPQLWDSILNLVQDSDLTSRAVNKCGSTKTGDFPALLLTCRTLQEPSLDWFYRQKLTIRAKYWPSEPTREFRARKLLTGLLSNTRNVRVDYSGLSYEQLNAQHPVVVQLADIWRATNKLSSVVLFVPPHYGSLPQITWDPAIKQLLGPLLHPSGFSNKIHWDPTDFASNIGPRMTALCRATIEENEELVHFLLQQSHDVLNRNGIGNATPLDVAVTKGNIKIVKHLVDTGEVDVNSVGAMAFTPVHLAVAFGHGCQAHGPCSKDSHGRAGLHIESIHDTSRSGLHTATK